MFVILAIYDRGSLKNNIEMSNTNVVYQRPLPYTEQQINLPTIVEKEELGDHNTKIEEITVENKLDDHEKKIEEITVENKINDYKRKIEEIIEERSDNCNGRIDVVWTYVNGSDPKFIEKLKKFKNRIDPQRYRDYGSLFYSMRSVFENVKFAKKWFLVVESESQIPTFLNQSTFQESDGYHLEIIYHHQIFPHSKDLPNFNSASIESTFHRIPGLSECFIYLNDDFFIHNPVNKSFFVESDGRPKVYLSPMYVPTFMPYKLWSRQLRYTNIALNNFFKTPNEKENTFHTITRNDVVIPFMHGHFALEQNLSVSYLEEDFHIEYMSFEATQRQTNEILEFLNNTNLTLYCLNDKISPKTPIEEVNKQSEILSSKLEYYYPEPTPFEIRDVY
ncbi:Capsular polysaccharide phosphotransferase sacB [Entamoeba marina]